MAKTLDKPFIPRCPKCFLIPSLSLIIENNEHKIEYECENQHKGILSFDNFVKECSKFNLENITCLSCKKNRNENINLYYFYCFQCKNYLCNKCMNIHDEKLKEKHFHFVSIEKLDGFCAHHYNSFSQYCPNHKRNLCSLCENEEHKDCKLLKIDISPENEKNEFMNIIERAIKKKSEIEDFQKQINESFEEIKRKLDEIIFLKNLIFSYEEQQKYLIVNYNILGNLKAFKSIAKLNEKKFELISKYSNKLINLFKTGNFKTIIKHTNYIDYIKILPDGRLLSCSEDGTINVYKENFKLEQKINVGSGVVYLNTLLDNNIIACCFDGKMRIYELKKDGTNLIKELEGHTDIVLKVLKIGNILISCSRDKTMKIWEKKENDYNCMKSIVISDNYGQNTNVLQINENKLVSSAYISNYIKFFDIKNNYNEITTIKNISVNWSWNSMEIFNKIILLIGGSDNNGIYLIDTNNYQIISNILKDFGIYSIIKLSNGNILIGCESGKDNSLIEYKYDNNNLIKVKTKEKAHSLPIAGLNEMKDGIIISYSVDHSIKLWI